MRVLVAANLVPFMQGGAENHINGLVEHLEAAGVNVCCLRIPFRFNPLQDIVRAMEFCEAQDFNRPNGIRIDKAISLQFPAWGIQHDDHRVWVMHQHRAVYELYDQQPASDELAELKANITTFDNRVLGRAKKLFANSGRVAERLQTYNRLAATALYHPPKGAGQFYTDDPYDYLFCPSRLERLKRQDLLIESARYVQSQVKILISGDGGQKDYYQSLIDQYQLNDRVSLIGRVTEQEMRTLYARSIGVFFAPFDEDYGYITLEAMLSAKPIITCTDSGGPLEFVEHENNGFVLPPDPKRIGEAIDQLYLERQKAKAMGKAGREIYRNKDISWQSVIEMLLAD